MREIKYIVIHHSAGKDYTLKDIGDVRRHHIKNNKWADIGYHGVIKLIGTEFEVLIGRPLHISGAHTPGRNTDSIGFCFIGNYSLTVPSVEMIRKAVKYYIVPMMKAFDIPVENVLKHSEVNSTECPGKLFSWDYLINQIKKQL